MTSNFVHFTDFIEEFSVMDRDSSKLKVDKATQIINAEKDFLLENIQERAQDVVLKYLDTTLTYKLKTGMFKVEDSLSLTSEDNHEEDKQEFEIKELKSKANKMLNDTRPNPKSLFHKILDADYYSYSLQNVTFYNNEMVYAISFKPKRAKAKYTGTLHIADYNYYGVLKADYSFSKGKRGSKVNLHLILGVKYIEKISSGTIIFKKNENNWFELRYIKHEEGHYFYINRPLKYIENSSSRNKTLFNFKIEGIAKHKEELLLTSTTEISSADFNTIKEVKIIPYKKQRKYDATIWEGSETLAPTEELKTFDANNN